MNRGGFSWNRLLGITRVKTRISRATGIPLTRSGRQRKLGQMMGGCVLPAALALVVVAAVATVLMH